MAKQTLNNGEAGSVIREKINENFTEVYDAIAGFVGGTVDTVLADGSLNAISNNAVFDALSLKAPLQDPAFTGTVSGRYLTFTADAYNANCFVKIKVPTNESTTIGAGLEIGAYTGAIAQIGFDNSGTFRVNGAAISNSPGFAKITVGTNTGAAVFVGGMMFGGASGDEHMVWSDNTYLCLSTGRLSQLMLNGSGVIVNTVSGTAALNMAYSSVTLNPVLSARWRMSAAGVRISEVGNGSGAWQTAYSEEYDAGGVKLALFGATRIARPTTSHAAATRTGGGGAALTATDTFDGYTIGQVVKALRDLGALT